MGKLGVEKHIRRCTGIKFDFKRIAGNEDKMGSDTYISDESEGIIPRSVRYLWQ